MDDWILPGLIYAAALLHHVLAIRSEQRDREKCSLLHRQLEMLREAIALARYGAQDEAANVIDEAVAIGDEHWK